MGSIGKQNRCALVFGASGVSGWAFVNELLHDYPEKGSWAQVHALVNRPLKREDALWPDDSRLHIVSGVDILKATQEELERILEDKVQGIERVTHVYYLAYKFSADVQQEMRDAARMIQSSITAMHHLSPNLEFVVLQTGAKMYGVHLTGLRPTDYIHVPHAESMPRLKSPYGELLFYHLQLDWILEYAKDKPWNWCETRPDIIVGFVPHGNFYSLSTALGIFLALYAEIEGPDARCPFPGTARSWIAKSNDASADMIARQTIYLSLTLSMDQKGEAYNIADAKEPETWSTKWPQLCRYFGLIGEGPPVAGEESIEVRKYIKTNFETWKKMEQEYGLKSGIADSDLTVPGFEEWLLSQFDFDRQYDMTKMYATGFQEERTVMQTYGLVFDRMRAAKIIP